MRNDSTIDVVDWLSCEALRDIRRAVFIDEQRVPEDEEWDADDARSVHFLLSASGQPVGTARLLSDGHIGRVAILREWRGYGHGKALMLAAMQHGQRAGMAVLRLSAQSHALAFYEQLGFVVDSGEYLEAGIPHHRMVWRSDTIDSAPELAPIEFSSPGRFAIHNPEEHVRPRPTSELPQQLGKDRDLVQINEQDALQHACNFVMQARRSLSIYAPDQALWLFNQREFNECCEYMVASGTRARIRILVQEVNKELLLGYSLVRLMHRFPSFCEIRRQHRDLQRDPHICLLADDAGILMLPRAVTRNGFVRYDSRDQVRRHLGRFDELWQSSQTDPALRRFLL